MKQTYMVYCTVEGEDPFMVEGETFEEAQTEALKELGWHLIQTEDDIKEEEL